MEAAHVVQEEDHAVEAARLVDHVIEEDHAIDHMGIDVIMDEDIGDMDIMVMDDHMAADFVQ